MSKSAINNNTYYKNWYEVNKEKHLAYMKEKMMCDCEVSVGRTNLKRHMETAKHKKWEKESEKFIKCKCGGCYNLSTKHSHSQGKQHQKFLKSLYNVD
jgi:hypothetical protein